jgi:hypothetical protein
VNYAVTVLNKDTAACPQATMGLTPSVPAGWSGTLSPTAVALLPGATGTATFAVKAPNPASSGSNTVRVNVFDSLEALHTATASAIATIDDSAPSAPTNLKATVKGKQIQLTWTVSTDNVGVSSYGIWRSGVRIGTATGTSYTDTSTKRGTSYTYYVVATDSVGNSSAPSNSVTVQQ